MLALYSKSKVDKAGASLAKGLSDNEDYDIIVDWWRENHIAVLADVTLKLIEWFSVLEYPINVNQRLKRKPQIIRKIKRKPNMRLSQMRDIGGCRAIFESNEQLEEAANIIKTKSARYKFFKIVDVADYRMHGRQESGYRALHITVERHGVHIEIQLRTTLQHAWAESIERTSVLCEYALKEGEGPQVLIDFFKTTSDAFCAVDGNKKIPEETIKLMNCQEKDVENIVSQYPKMAVGGRELNENFMRAMVEKEQTLRGKIKNWLLVFDWKAGVFISWREMGFNPEQISKTYSEEERRYSYENGYEVVLIGSSNVASIRDTHSHYFGVESYEEILDSIHYQITTYRDGLSTNAYQVLKKLYSHSVWGTNCVRIETLSNHYCPSIDCKAAIDELRARRYVAVNGEKISMVSSKRNEISRVVGQLE